MIMRSLIRRTASSLFFNSRNRHFFTHPTNPMKETGLYGCKHLKTPKGFRRLVHEAIERSNELVGYVSGMPSSSEIVKSMDEILNIVNQVRISARFCSETHPDSEFVDEALNASRRIRKYENNLYTNLTLYNAMLKVDQDQTLTSIEAKRFAREMLFKHENHGINLSSEKKDRVSQLKAVVGKCYGLYYKNIDKEPDFEYTYPKSCLPKNLRNIAAPVNRLSTILEKKRQRAYIIINSVPRANVDVVDILLATRRGISQIMGYKSYADYVVQSNMASSSDVVSSFLDELSKTVKPKAVEEFQSIRNFKRKINGEDRLEPWDKAHFQTLMKSSAYNLDFSVIASYLSLTQSIEGLKVIAKSLFGMELLNCPLAPGESWHPNVTKMSLHHPDEGDLGYIYLDLISREGKDSGDAIFTIRRGCRVSKTEYQLPVVAITCNFSKPRNSTVVRLDLNDVETLFHEFGHALDSLLSRTDYQLFSGTRAAYEIDETPSQLFEYYAWDYRVLKKFARHYSIGDTIPEKLVDSMIGARKMFKGMELQQQIFYSSVDQALFGITSSPTFDTTSIVADLTKQHTNWEHVKGTHYQTRCTHLLSHSAEYYVYLYGKCFASTIWERVCKEDPLSLETGTVIRTKFLQHGGAKDPARLLQDVGGDGIIRYQNGGGIVPDITSLCNEMDIRN